VVSENPLDFHLTGMEDSPAPAGAGEGEGKRQRARGDAPPFSKEELMKS